MMVLATYPMGSPTSGIMAEGGVIGSFGTATPWLDFICRASQPMSFITPRAPWNRTLVETTAVLTSCSSQGGDYTPDGLPLTRLNTRCHLNHSRRHYLAFHHTGMRLPNMPIAFLLLNKFSHTANDRACYRPMPGRHQL
jgi:hypothetical protein